MTPYESGKYAAMSAMGMPMPAAVKMTGGGGGYRVDGRPIHSHGEVSSQRPKFEAPGSFEQSYWLPGTA